MILIDNVVVAFLAIIPLETMFQWGGEQMALYLGKVRILFRILDDFVSSIH